jgi:ankyrin repeat protein
MNLEQLRKQAKELLKAARAGDDTALRRLDGREPLLANAQLVLAREHGFPSWPALVTAAEADVDAFVQAATERQKARADEMLAARPEIERDPWARLVLGRGWEGDPNRPGGPRNWAPILYASHSPYANADLVRNLLARGADPNASSDEEWGRSTALYGAAGVVHDPERTRVLLEAGADPDDSESLYHSTETESPECLRLLLAHGAETRGTNALPRALDFDRIEPVRMLLEAGADPNEWPMLTHAIRRGRGPDVVRLLAEHGAELDRAGGEIEQWRQEVPPRTPYAQAMLRGRDDVAEALAELGASTELDPADAGVAALVRGDGSASLPDELDLDQQEAIIRSAMRGNLDATIQALGPDFHGVSDGSPDGTLLHHAAWYGDGEGVRKLLAAGARVQRDPDGETPLEWAVWSSRHMQRFGLDLVPVAEALVEHGEEIHPRYLNIALGPLREWLELQLPGEL